MAKEKDNTLLTPKNLTKNIVKWMSYGGCNPFERTLRKQFIGYVYVFISALLVPLVALNFAFTPHETVSSLMEDSIMVIGFVQIGAKYLTLIRKSKFLADMFDSIWNDFWAVESCDEKFQKSFFTIYRRARNVGNIYTTVIMLTTFMVIVQAGIKIDKTLVMEIWIPHKEILKMSPYYEIIFSCQAFFLATSVWFSIIQLDRLFILLICFVYVQQRMIQAKIYKIKRENSKIDNWEIIQTCVFHQNILFRFLKNFEQVFSIVLLPTVTSNFILTSLCMYGVIMEESISRRITLMFAYMNVMGQLFAYCYAGHLIQEEGMKIGDAAYNNDWYEIDDENVKMALMLINLRSQRKIELSVGGIMILSLENFAAVARATFTFLTFIINVRS